jgi:hypothetical protein
VQAGATLEATLPKESTMSVRSLAGAVLTTTALAALPVAASARPAPEEIGPAPLGAPSVQTASTTDTPPTVIERDGPGAGTITVLAIAGGTLLAGAAGGFGGGWALRRQALRP